MQKVHAPIVPPARSIHSKSLAYTLVHRWGPAELCGKSIGLVIWILGCLFNAPQLLLSGFSTWGENSGFYATNIYRRYKEKKQPPRLGLIRAIFDTVSDFGVSEIADLFLVRPLGIYSFSAMAVSLFGDTLLFSTLGWLVGSILADIIFYSFATASFRFKIAIKNRTRQL